MHWLLEVHLQNQEVFGGIIAHFMEDQKYIVPVDSFRCRFSISKETAEVGIIFMLISVKFKSSHLFLCPLILLQILFG